MAVFGIDKALYAKSESERQAAEQEAARLRGDLTTTATRLAEIEQQLAASQTENSSLGTTVAERDASIIALDQSLAQARARAAHLAEAAPYSDAIVAELPSDDSDDIDEAALQVAADVVKARIADQVTATRTNTILNQDEQELRVTYGPEAIAQVDANLRTIFENDGTFEQHRRDIRDSIYTERRAVLLEADKAAVLTELRTPEAKEATDIAIRQDPDYLADIATYRQLQLEMLRADWEREAEEAGEAAALEEIMAEKAAFVAEKAAEWAASDAAEKFKARNRKKLEADWEKEAADKVAAEVGDEQLQQLLREKAAALTTAEQKAKLYREVLDHMDREGIDTRLIHAGSLTNVYLGSIDEYETNKTKKPRIVASRIIRTVANGDGSFTVNEDTLHESPNGYARRFAIEPGTIVQFGREVTIGDKKDVEPLVRRNVPLVTKFGDGQQDISIDPVVNVLVDECSADTTIATIQLPYNTKSTFWFPKQS